MPFYKQVPDYYLPENIPENNKELLLKKRALQIALTKDRNQQNKLQKLSNEIQLRLENEIKTLKAKVSFLSEVAPPILVASYYPSKDTPFPLNRLLNDLNLKKFTQPESVIKRIDIAIEEYKKNTVPSLLASLTEFDLLKYNLIEPIKRANEFGKQLATDFSEFKASLSRLQGSLDEIVSQQKKSNALVMSAREALRECHPKTRVQKMLAESLQAALQKVFDDASRNANSNVEAAGIRGVTRELLKKNILSGDAVDQIREDFRTLENLRPNGYGEQKLALLKEIIAAHSENIKKIEAGVQKDYEPDKELDFYQELIDKLDEYLENRANYRDLSGQTSNYFYWGLFSCFSASFSFEQKKNAVESLKSVLRGENDGTLLNHLPALMQGHLGSLLKQFIDEGKAKDLLPSGRPLICTVKDLIESLNAENSFTTGISLAT